MKKGSKGPGLHVKGDMKEMQHKGKKPMSTSKRMRKKM